MLISHSDVLQKHIKGHAAKNETAERNKRACQPCHRAKTRCSGGLPCQSCLKRGIQCILETHRNGSINPRAGKTLEQASPTEDYNKTFGSVRSASTIESSQYRYGSAGSIYVEPPFFKEERNSSIVTTPLNVTSRVEMNSQIFNLSNAVPSNQANIQFDPSWQFAVTVAPVAPQPNSGYLNGFCANPINIEAVESSELYFSHFHIR